MAVVEPGERGVVERLELVHGARRGAWRSARASVSSDQSANGSRSAKSAGSVGHAGRLLAQDAAEIRTGVVACCW